MRGFLRIGGRIFASSASDESDVPNIHHSRQVIAGEQDRSILYCETSLPTILEYVPRSCGRKKNTSNCVGKKSNVGKEKKREAVRMPAGKG